MPKIGTSKAPGSNAAVGFAWARRDWLALWLLSVLGIVAAWPVAPAPSISRMLQSGDATIQAYMLGWGGHTWLRDPLNYFNLPAFYPMRSALTNMDSLILPAMLVSPVWGATGDFTLTYNVGLLLSYVFNLTIGYLVLRLLLPVPRSAALAASVAFTVNINHYWHASQHLNLVWTGMLPLAFMAGWRLASRPGCGSALAVAFTLLASALFSWYLLVFALFATPAGALGAVVTGSWSGVRRSIVWTMAAAGLSAGLIAPYAWVYAAAPADRRPRGSIAECEKFSVAAVDWFFPPARQRTISVPLGEKIVDYLPPQDRAADDPVFPGWAFELALLLECGRLARAWRRRAFAPLDRLSLLALLGAATSILLSLGPYLDMPWGRIRGPYWFLHHGALGFANFFRTPMRFAFLFQTFFLFSVAIFLSSAFGEKRMTLRVASAILIVAAFAEHWPARTWERREPSRTPILSELDRLDPGGLDPIVFIPEGGAIEAAISGPNPWRPMVNGFAFAPLAPDYEAFFGAMDDFPTTRSLALLEKRRVTWVVALQSRFADRSRKDARVEVVAARGEESLIRVLPGGEALKAWEEERTAFRKRVEEARTSEHRPPVVLIADYLSNAFAPIQTRQTAANVTPRGLRLRPDIPGFASFVVYLDRPLDPWLADELRVTLSCDVGIEDMTPRAIWQALGKQPDKDSAQAARMARGAVADTYEMLAPLSDNPAWLKGLPVQAFRIDLYPLPPSRDLEVFVQQVALIQRPEAPTLPF